MAAEEALGLVLEAFRHARQSTTGAGEDMHMFQTELLVSAAMPPAGAKKKKKEILFARCSWSSVGSESQTQTGDDERIRMLRMKRHGVDGTAW